MRRILFSAVSGLGLAVLGLSGVLSVAPSVQAAEPGRKLTPPEPIVSSWDDLTDGLKTKADWHARRVEIKARFLDLIRDQYKPAKRPALDLQVHERVIVEGLYERRLISYAVEDDERAHAYIGFPLKGDRPFPAVVALHGTSDQGKELAAGLIDEPGTSRIPDRAYLDQLCRRGYVVIAPDHFVAGHRKPKEGSYVTKAFYDKHPEWTAVGKFTWEHSIAIDVLQSMPEVDGNNIGVIGHSLGGQGALFLGAYDERVKAVASNCTAATFRQNAKALEWSRDRWYIYLKPLREEMLKGNLPPIDFHEIMALIAPRALMDLSGFNDGNGLTQRQRVLGLLKVADIYELEKVPQNFSFYTHGRAHSIKHESRQLIAAFLDAHLKPESATKTRTIGEVTPVVESK